MERDSDLPSRVILKPANTIYIH